MVTRRGILTGGVASLGSLALGRAPQARSSRPRRVLRVAFITDSHVNAQPNIRQGFARCLLHVRNETKPDLIFQGGDLVMDALAADRATALAQYDAAARVLRENCDVPVSHCLGNHDVWGWDRTDRTALASDPQYGKGLWRRFTGYNSTYYSFDRAGWHFVFLDSVQPRRSRGFTAALDEAQWAWFQSDLAAVDDHTPICIVSHVPVLIGAGQFFGPFEGNGHGWHVPSGMSHTDARRIKDLLAKHENVNLWLSGHVHLTCRTDYNGVAHLGTGAVCGAWWKGAHQETEPGYRVVDLYANGHFSTRYVTY